MSALFDVGNGSSIPRSAGHRSIPRRRSRKRWGPRFCCTSPTFSDSYFWPLVGLASIERLCCFINFRRLLHIGIGPRAEVCDPQHHFLCHPDAASNASGRTWLLASGQLRASEAGSGFRKSRCAPSDSHWKAATQNRNRRCLRPAVRDPSCRSRCSLRQDDRICSPCSLRSKKYTRGDVVHNELSVAARRIQISAPSELSARRTNACLVA